MKTQYQFYRESQNYIADCNKTFLELVRNGMTRKDLETNIKRRPELWSRFSNWLEKLPEGEVE